MSPTYISEQLLTTNLFVNAKNVSRNIDNFIKDSLKELLGTWDEHYRFWKNNNKGSHN